MLSLQELFEDHQMYHSEFQQDYFITSKSGGTPYGMYKQALRELHKRYRGLKGLYAEKELLQVDIDELEADDSIEFEARRQKIKHAQKIMHMEELDLNISETEREFKRFYQQAVVLKEQIGELTEVKRKKLDIEMWTYKLKEQIAIDFICMGRIQHNTLENIMCLPITQRKTLLYFVRNDNHEELIEWYESRNQSYPEMRDIDIKKIMG